MGITIRSLSSSRHFSTMHDVCLSRGQTEGTPRWADPQSTVDETLSSKQNPRQTLTKENGGLTKEWGLRQTLLKAHGWSTSPLTHLVKQTEPLKNLDEGEGGLTKAGGLRRTLSKAHGVVFFAPPPIRLPLIVLCAGLLCMIGAKPASSLSGRTKVSKVSVYVLRICH